MKNPIITNAKKLASLGKRIEESLKMVDFKIWLDEKSEGEVKRIAFVAIERLIELEEVIFDEEDGLCWEANGEDI